MIITIVLEVGIRHNQYQSWMEWNKKKMVKGSYVIPLSQSNTKSDPIHLVNFTYTLQILSNPLKIQVKRDNQVSYIYVRFSIDEKEI